MRQQFQILKIRWSPFLNCFSRPHHVIQLPPSLQHHPLFRDPLSHTVRRNLTLLTLLVRTIICPLCSLIVLLGEPPTWNHLPWPGPIVTTCMSYPKQEVLVRNVELTSYHQPREFSRGLKERGDVSLYVLPTSQTPLTGINLGWTICITRKDPESERLTRDNLETNPTTIKPETKAARQSSPADSLPLALCPGAPSQESLLLCQHVCLLRQSISELEKSPLLGNIVSRLESKRTVCSASLFGSWKASWQAMDCLKFSCIPASALCLTPCHPFRLRGLMSTSAGGRNFVIPVMSTIDISASSASGRQFFPVG